MSWRSATSWRSWSEAEDREPRGIQAEDRESRGNQAVRDKLLNDQVARKQEPGTAKIDLEASTLLANSLHAELEIRRDRRKVHDRISAEPAARAQDDRTKPRVSLRCADA